MKLRWSLPLCLVLLCACSSKPPLAPAVAISEVAQDVRVGAARSFENCAWYPDSAGFSTPTGAVRREGQLVLMDQALLWGQFDLSSGLFRVGRKIPFAQIRSLALAQKEGGQRIVVQDNNGRVDSFAIERHAERRREPAAADPAATTDAWRTLLAQLGM
ncbi:MAG: hypothetical protein JWP36_1723 [Paucimonas sp.]|jgi:hypothetical protein|nr:hypothetical protein [Paucimonas sp.]